MFNLILIFISVVAAAITVAGIVILLRPAPKAEQPVRKPVDVIKVVSVDSEVPEEESEDTSTAPVSTMERELELADMHEGDIIAGDEPSPEPEEENPVPSHDVPEEAPAPEQETPRPEEPSDVVSKSISEEHEEDSDTPPDRPLELFEDLTYQQ